MDTSLENPSRSNDSTRTHFNEVAAGKEFGSYESRRWSANAKQEAQRVATEAFVTNIAVPLVRGAHHIVELGAGPGTWTKYLHEAAPNASFTLTDIAGEMLQRAKSIFPASTSVTLVESDFTESPLPKESADVFFSSRAIEYITPKEVAVQKIADTLRSGGTGIVVTKMPKRRLNNMLGRVSPKLHSEQFYPQEFAGHLKKSGLRDAQFYPVTFSFPIIRSAALDRILASLFGRKTLTPLSALFAESYGVTFKKP